MQCKCKLVVCRKVGRQRGHRFIPTTGVEVESLITVHLVSMVFDPLCALEVLTLEFCKCKCSSTVIIHNTSTRFLLHIHIWARQTCFNFIIITYFRLNTCLLAYRRIYNETQSLVYCELLVLHLSILYLMWCIHAYIQSLITVCNSS
jgi:hypothetical protein